MALKSARTWFQKNGTEELGPGTSDPEVIIRGGQAMDSKKGSISPYYYGHQASAVASLSGSRRQALGEVNGHPSSSNGRNASSYAGPKQKVHFKVNGDAPHQDLSIAVPADSPNVKGSGCFNGGTNEGDDSPGSTFEIPLDEIYNFASKSKEKPRESKEKAKTDEPVLTRSRSKTSKPKDSSVRRASKEIGTSSSVDITSLNHHLSEKISLDRKYKSEIYRGPARQSSSSSSSRKTDDPLYRKYARSAPAVKQVRTPGIPIQGVASGSYCHSWLPADGMLPSPQDIQKFNKFLKNCRSEVEAGVPGRWLTVVMGNETADLDSIVSTITYAFFLGSTGSEDQQCFVPVLNMRREDFALHTEAVWLFECTGVDVDSIIFIDQISLSYFHRFGSLRLILVDHSRLAPHQENLQEAVVEIVDHAVNLQEAANEIVDHAPENLYPWVSTLEIEQVGSCSTIIAERYAAEAPQLAAGRGLNRLLLAAILLDTNNLESNSSRCTSRDECMAAFLLHGAGRYGRHGFYKLLRKKKYDVSGLTPKDTMRKDFKQWTVGPGKTDVYGCKGRIVATGMTTIGMALYEFLRRDAKIMNDIQAFRRSKKLDILIIITGHYDNANKYKREILIAPEDEGLTQHLARCFKAHTEQLKLSPLHIDGLPKDVLVFIQGNVTESRKTIRSILSEFFAS